MKLLYGEDAKILKPPFHSGFARLTLCALTVTVKVAECVKVKAILSSWSGMVHPKVLANLALTLKNIQVCIRTRLERIVMRRYGITDMRLFLK